MIIGSYLLLTYDVKNINNVFLITHKIGKHKGLVYCFINLLLSFVCLLELFKIFKMRQNCHFM